MYGRDWDAMMIKKKKGKQWCYEKEQKKMIFYSITPHCFSRSYSYVVDEA